VRGRWTELDVCRVMLGSSATADQRRRVRRRTIAFNRELERICDRIRRCRFDDHRVFAWDFRRKHLTGYDWFHLSPRGERRLAAITWKATPFAR
jgi:hypothetical protein